MTASEYAKMLATNSPLAAAINELADIDEAVDDYRAQVATRTINRHHFDSTAAARAAADHIPDGDVVVVEAENVIGFAVAGQLAALTPERGTFGHLPAPAHEYCAGDYVRSAVVAEQEGFCLGIRIRAEHATPRSLAHRADTVPVDAGDTRAHFADTYASKALCGDPKRRTLDDSERADRLLCPPCLAAARDRAATREAARDLEVEAARAARAARAAEPPRPVKAHRFDSTSEAYDASQCRDAIHDGDVLVIPSEGVVAVLRGAWPAALTTARGELHRLTEPAGDIKEGQYRASVMLAAEEAARIDVTLDPLHQPAEPCRVGDRFIAADGAAHTVTKTTRDAEGRLWLHTPHKSAWRADQSEPIDTTLVDDALTAARRTGRALSGPNPPAGALKAELVQELGEALQYLAQAAPDELEALAGESVHRVTVEVPRISVATGDIAHLLGVRLNVLATGITDAEGGATAWWVDVHGATEADRHATYRMPWRMAVDAAYAAWDVVTVERLAPTRPS